MEKARKSKTCFIWLLMFCLAVFIGCSDIDDKKGPLNPGDDGDDDPFNFGYKLIKTFDAQHDFYVDCDNNYIFTSADDGVSSKIRKYDFNGNLLIESNVSYVSWIPYDIAVCDNKVYVLDNDDKVKVLDYNLKELAEITLADADFHNSIYVKGDHIYTTVDHRVIKYSNTGAKLFEFGSYGSDNEQFNYPRDVIIDSAGNYYVADSINRRLKVFDANGNFKYAKKIIYKSNGDIMPVSHIDIDNNDNIYVGIKENDYHAAFYLIKNNGKEGISNLDTDSHFQSDGISVTSTGLVVTLDRYNKMNIKIYQP